MDVGDTMVFNYYRYCQVHVVRPLFSILVGAVGLAVYTCPQIVALVSDPLEYMHLLTPIVGAGSLLMLFAFSGGYPFWSGGFHLLREKPKDVVCINGKIETIRECSPFKCLNYDTDHGHSYGYEMRVNGVVYVAMNHPRCTAGSRVTLTVLPRSRVVLAIMRRDEEQ